MRATVKGESIVNYHSLRNSLTTVVLAFGAAVLLAACGGGGAGGNPNQGGAVSITPNGGTFYAGVPVTFTVQGGRAPYAITSSEPNLLPVPSIIEDHQFTTIPNNPGVIDAGLQPGELPTRSVVITVRDSTGVLISTQDVRVAQNFVTGYGVAFTSTNCPADSSGTADPPGQACAGGETVFQMLATFNGNLAGGRQFRVEVLRGNFSLRNPATGQASSSIVLTSAHDGVITGIIEVPLNAPSQLAVLRVIDVQTGVYSDTVFTISGRTQGTTLTVLPNEFTFTGALTTQCGTGTADFLVFDGVPPFTAISSSPNVSVTPSVSNSNPGRFTITANNRDTCVANATIVVTDSRGAVGTATVTTNTGSIAPTPPAAFAVGPSTLILGCGQTGSVAVVGGTGNYFATSSNPNVVAVASGNTVSITRLGRDPGTGGTIAVAIGVSDGRTISTVTATVPATCAP